jgi:hypothetical protein
VKRYASVDSSKFRGLDELRVRYRHGVKFAVDIARPEIEELCKHWVLWCEIQMLPEKFLEETRVIGHVVEDLGCGESVTLQLQLKCCHQHSPIPLRRTPENRARDTGGKSIIL